MSRADRVRRIAETMRDVYDLGDELGLWTELLVWWRARPPVVRRKARRAQRREQRRQ